MRLEKIKLAGFKSFVDPTTVLFPSNLCGIVGPNGCGKSNVIDAVRWVMGESSAKMLRGESMADVIFNGSTSRQPVGLASIELLFDNGDGAAGGEYAKYTQISVKRQVSRDGQSNYFLNGARCRRRDIQDLFLGTGLGPRSYAIIEQGMISRLIEARPEDLRLFLEEAAGISKYKERRRETETRIRNTRENLSRLDDLREEVAKQLLHLERQAATAEKYKRHKEEERRFDAELKAMRWRALDRDLDQGQGILTERELALEAAIARQRHVEAEIEQQRELYSQSSDHFNLVQGRYYAIGGEIARLEQGIQFARENRRRQEVELGRLERERAEVIHLLAQDQAVLVELDERLAAEEPALAEAEEGREGAVEQLEAAEKELKVFEARWDDFNRETAGPAQQAQVERSRINHLEQRLGQDKSRLTRLEEELGRLETHELEEQIRALECRESELGAKQVLLAEERDRLAAALAVREMERRDLSQRLDGARTRLQAARGRQSSLVALQEAALSDGGHETAAWLAEQRLAESPRLLDVLKVEPGWELAVETILGPHLMAVRTPDLDLHADALRNAGGAVTLWEGRVPGDAHQSGAHEPQAEARGSLLDLVDCSWPLGHLLATTRPAENLDQALAARADLGPGQTLVTREGIQVGPHWLLSPPRNDPRGGVLARGEILKASAAEILDLEAEVESLVAALEAARDQRRAMESERETLQDRVTAVDRGLAQVRADLSGRHARLEHRHERRRALTAECNDLRDALEEAFEEMAEGRERLHAALEAVEIHAERRETLAGQREALRAAVVVARAQERDWGDREHRLRVGIESRRASRDVTTRGMERAREQVEQLAGRVAEVRQILADLVEPLAEQEERLEEQLGLRLEAEAALAQARDRLEALDQAVRGLEQERHRLDEVIRAARSALDDLRLVRQERLVLRRTLEEQLQELSLDPTQVLTALTDPAAEVEEWQRRLEQIGQRIARLGNINLAAIDEFQAQSERKHYLDAQHEDIARSLETLEQVIRRIDRETRGRFKDTYDQVNQGLQRLFPRLFGGGHAYLELTGEDLLETGVAVMARPPGKRNSSIHLLSGGEKALTAVALVFAIFQLNPAPFCLLDEVDAPLDDANVGRFCELVRSLSDQVQIIFISHNKVTMEIADHLMGVTMHEPGVSRLVSVDVEEAALLATSS
ncbi:MAG: chromosome segregation protein SMC [Gammaproteobacteria bacterium]|nr:MAG: chromosome segregation protein SMC [Gammaproteobacteria bacterium]